MKEFRQNGYIYSSKTVEGFNKMKRQGIPRPLFRVQDKLSKATLALYKKVLKKLFKQLKARLYQSNIVSDEKDEGTLEELLRFFEERGKELQAESESITQKENARFLANELEKEWLESEQDELARLDDLYNGDIDDNFKPIIERFFKENETDYLARLKNDSSPKLQNIMNLWEIDKNQFFEDNLKEVRRLYVDNSLRRIAGETDLLKIKIIKAISDYATGKAETLDINELAKECLARSESLSRYFARDQMQRFNKACTLATFQQANVSKVRWWTSNDGRVRESHKALNGKIFDITNLPPEIDDYNCRCGLEPVEYYEGE